MTKDQKLTKIKVAIRYCDQVIERYQNNGSKPAVILDNKIISRGKNSPLGFCCVTRGQIAFYLKKSVKVNKVCNWAYFFGIYVSFGWLKEISMAEYKKATRIESNHIAKAKFFKVNIPVLKGELPQRAEMMFERLVEMGLESE